MFKRHRLATTPPALALCAAACIVWPAAASQDKLGNVHTVAIVSILGNEVDMQTGGTRFDYADYKLHTDWNFDALIHDYVANAVHGRFAVKDDALDTRIFSAVKSPSGRAVWARIGDILQAAPQKPDVDAVIVVYPNESPGPLSPGLGIVHEAPSWLGSGTTIFGATYALGIYDAKTGDRIDYGTGRYPASGTLSGYTFPWEMCPASIWADSEDKLTPEQKGGIRQELWSLVTRSLPYALTNSGLISKSNVESLNASATAAGPSCHSLP
jgi:hypothetical protein